MTWTIRVGTRTSTGSASRRRRLAAPAALLVAAGILTGCGGNGQKPPATPSYPTSTVPLVSPNPSSSSSTSAQAGSTNSRDKSFSAVFPVDWSPVKSSATGMMLFEGAPSATHGVRTNFNVIRQNAPYASPSEVLQQSSASLQQAGWTVRPAAALTIGGLPAQSVTATTSLQGKKVAVHQFYVLKGSSVYIASMTSSPQDVVAAQKTATAIFGTWAWSAS